MIRTIVTSPSKYPELFCKTVLYNPNNKEQEIRNTARLGSSKTWRYYIDEIGEAIFFFIDKNGEAVKCPKTTHVYPGNFIWFIENKSTPTYGIAYPPCNDFRKVFWDSNINSQREIFYFNATQEEFNEINKISQKKFEEDAKRIKQTQISVNSVSNIGKIIMYAMIKNEIKEVVFVDLYRRTQHSEWNIESLYVRKGYDTVEIAKEIVESIKNCKGVILSVI